MRFSAVKHLPLLVFFLALLGCGNPQEEATRQLGQMDIKFTADSFVERARDGNLAAVKLFLQAGMKPNVTSAAGETPLLVAVQFGRQDVVETLLAQGADPNFTDMRFGATPLMWASTKGYAGIMNLLLAKGAQVNAKNDQSGMTALMSAAVGGRIGIITVLLDKGAEINASDNQGRTALMWARPLWPRRGRKPPPGEGRGPRPQG